MSIECIEKVPDCWIVRCVGAKYAVKQNKLICILDQCPSVFSELLTIFYYY